ncbi:hypothetical protein BC827DRAFT_1227101 [Russula dissimulans]|nr:hypothetical protein BC827DRAFT_1227101 [Russula dissimulans]
MIRGYSLLCWIYGRPRTPERACPTPRLPHRPMILRAVVRTLLSCRTFLHLLN